jgi:HK97 family phage major capsid protein
MNIPQLQQQRAAKIQAARALLDAAGAQSRSLNETETTQYDGLLAEAEALKRSIEREQQLLALEAETARSVGTSGVQSTIATKREPGQGFINCVRALAVHKHDRRAAAHFAEQTLHDADVARALAASSGAAGGFTVPNVLSEEIIPYLRPASVVRASGARVVPMPSGNLALPKISGGASASYIGENTNIGKTEQTFGQQRWTARKLAALIPMSNDLLRFANPTTDAMIREDLVLAMGQAEDSTFIRSAGTDYAPRGLRYWANSANVFGANATVNVTNISSDLGTAQSNVFGSNVKPSNPGWLMAPRTYFYLKNVRNSQGFYAFPEMSEPTPSLQGYPVKWTSQIPTNLTDGTQSEVYFVNFGDMIIADSMQLILDVSSEAAYYDGSAVVAAFSQDQTVIRCIAQHDFAPRYDLAISVITGVKWY